ncbi:ATP-binding protein [Rhizobium ruizarguesonis]|uniref:ATP-binding protein n=1 Tax=Rhizobium ruizarguesonis TaxID=2081791 RepID=UPI0037C5A88A
MFGVSGAGKTTICTRFAARNPSFLHITASSLLDQHTSDRPRDVLAVQAEIVSRVRSLRLTEARRIILDGHCVIRSQGSLFRVPSSLVSELRPSMIVLIDSDPEFIAARRASRKDRRSEMSLDKVAEELDAAREACLSYRKELRVPLRVLAADQPNIAEKFGRLLSQV